MIFFNAEFGKFLDILPGNSSKQKFITHLFGRITRTAIVFQEIFQTLFLTISRFNKKASLFAYNEVRNRCMLTELYIKGNFYTIRPHEKTASSEVIKTIIKKSGNQLKKPVLIHITDCSSNWGCPVTDAIALCKKNRALLLTIGVNCSEENRKLLEAEYGSLVKFADTVDMLPPLLRALLNKGQKEAVIVLEDKNTIAELITVLDKTMPGFKDTVRSPDSGGCSRIAPSSPKSGMPTDFY